MSNISPLAYIHPDAVLGQDCEVGPFCYIDQGVTIGDHCTLMNSVTVLSGTQIGAHNTIFPGAVIGAIPQDLKFQGEESYTFIGHHNTIRENVTINRGTAAKGKTVVGDHNLLMEGMHVAHDVFLGNGCIIGNSTKIAGEVVIDDFATISASVLIHQFCHIGSYVMIGGGSKVGQDVPPYVLVAREPLAYYGLNLVGLRRRGFSKEQIDEIHEVYRLLYQKENLREVNLQQIASLMPESKHRDYILDFVHHSKRGIIS